MEPVTPTGFATVVIHDGENCEKAALVALGNPLESGEGIIGFGATIPGVYSLSAEYKPDASHAASVAAECLALRVAYPPVAMVQAPEGGGTYTEGEVVPTKFSCTEGEGGSGLESCGGLSDSSGTGLLNTEVPGEQSYVVTARSQDGLSGTSRPVDYKVISACAGIHGYGRVGSLAGHGVIVLDQLSMRAGAREIFEAGIQQRTLGQLRLRSLDSSSCRVIPGGREFRGEGPATLQGRSGYQAAFSFAVTGSHITLGLEVHKGTELLYSTSAPMLKGAVELFT